MRRSPTLALAAAIAGLLGAPTGATAAELVRDGGFEAGIAASPWAQADRFVGRHLWSTGTPLCVNVPGSPAYCRDAYSSPGRAAPHSGGWWAWFGGYNFIDGLLGLLDPTPHTSSLSQAVTLTAGTPATLSFRLWIGRADAASVLNVSLGGTTLFAVRGDDARYHGGYAQVVVPVSGAIATGQPQALSFDYVGAVTLLQYPIVNVDDVSLQVADVDLGVGLSSTPAQVTRGSTFTTTLAAGNAGPHAAGEVDLEYPLPAGATLVGLAGEGACAAAATTPGHVVHCDFGTLAPGQTKQVTATLRADAVGPIAQSATIGHRTGDTNPGNQVAHATVEVVEPEAPKPPATCTAPRRFTVGLQRGKKGSGLLLGSHRPQRSRILSARITGPKRFKARKLKHTRSRVTVDLRRLAAGRYTVRTRVRVSAKRTLTVNRTYNACGAASARR